MARLVLTIGDPTGIGPEVMARALADAPPRPLRSDVLLIGDAAVWKDAQRIAHVHLPAVRADRPGPITDDGVPFLDLPPADRSWRLGAMSPAAGRAAAGWLEHAAKMALDGFADGVVFAPLNKQAIIRAGYRVRDEYDLCAALAHVADHDEVNVIPHPADPRATDPGTGRLLWVTRATSHVALREVPGLLTVERVLRTIRLAHRVATGSGAAPLRIGVAAFNPHAGEGGLLGDEEVRVIRPAIEAAQQEGIAVSGPLPADHIFRQAQAGAWDVVIAMYHDQAQIATKLLGFARGVSVGVGYPFILATPSHGTAFDIAGKGMADAGPMRQAILLAERLAEAGTRS